MRRSRKQLEKVRARRESEIALHPLPRWNRLAASAAILAAAVVVGYAVELDVALRLGSGEVSGRMRWFDQRKPPPRYRELRWPVLVVENDQGKPLRYFHSFLPGLHRQISDALREHEKVHPAPPVPSVSPERPSTGSVITRRRPVHPNYLYGRVRYAGLGRKSVYAFAESPSDP